MDDTTKSIVKAILIVTVAVPVVATGISLAISGAIALVGHVGQQIEFKKRIKEGLKNGTIIKEGNNYYEVTIE